MAGLLDLFGQRDPNDPVNMGLLGMSAALGTPVRQGGGVGPAFGAFGQGFQSAQQAEMRRKLMEAQIEEMKRKEIPKPQSPIIPLGNGGYFDIAQNKAFYPDQNKPGEWKPVEGRDDTYLYNPRDPNAPKVPLGVGAKPRGQGVTVNLPGAEKAYTNEAGKGLAAVDVDTYKGALEAQEGNKALERVSKIIEESKVSAGPLAVPEVLARNLLSQLGIPINSGIDSANARLTAVASNRLASKIIKGGRALTDSDVKVIASAFPSFQSGIPLSALPDFIEVAKSINDDAIGSWQARYESLPPDYKSQFPATFGAHRSMTPPKATPNRLSKRKVYNPNTGDFDETD